MTDLCVDQLASLLRAAAAAHHQAFAAANGEDADWPSWYAAYLAPRLPLALGRHVEVPALAADLRRFDAEHRAADNSEPWTEFYARRLCQAT